MGLVATWILYIILGILVVTSMVGLILCSIAITTTLFGVPSILKIYFLTYIFIFTKNSLIL